MAKNSVPLELDRNAIEAALQTVEAESAAGPDTRRQPDGKEYFRQAWAESPLSMGISNRLRKVDYCIKALGAIHFVMHQDSTREALARDDDELVYDAIPAYVIENLRLGITELLAVAEECVEEIRENAHGIATNQAKGGR